MSHLTKIWENGMNTQHLCHTKIATTSSPPDVGLVWGEEYTTSTSFQGRNNTIVALCRLMLRNRAIEDGYSWTMPNGKGAGVARKLAYFWEANT